MTPEEARATDRERLAEMLADAFDEWLFRMHRVISSCDHAAEGTGLADVVLASDWLAEHDRRVRAEAAVEFAHWVAVARAHNGSDHERGQSLYNECLNAVLPTWASEWGRNQ